jgi:RimJ/RimL family protein N-acetyltransferase
MAHDRAGGVLIREPVPAEASRIADLYRSVYGQGYVHARFYDVHEIEKMIFDDDTLVLVAEEKASGRLVGSASVLFTMGAFTDLVGEFGRLVVHPDFRGRRIGTRLMAERLVRVGQRLHVGFAEVRVCNPSSSRISQRHGFVPVGALPQKLLFADTREHAGFLVKYFGDALSLRRNHPRVIAEAHHLAELALTGLGMEPDAIIDDEAVAYPGGRTFELEELTAQGYAPLLRIERGRVKHREVFGPQRLHYGLFKLEASHSHYVVARDGERIVGAIGYTRDAGEKGVRVFEVIHSEEGAVRPMFAALLSRCGESDVMSVQVDVAAHAPRMQRTLLELGFLPCAYVPAFAFQEVERVDVVKMYRLMEDLQDLPFDAPEPTLSVGRYVLSQFAKRQVLPRLARAMDRLDVCRGLTEEQTAGLLGEFATDAVQAGAELFGEGAEATSMILVIDGRATVSMAGGDVGTVGPGESLGEVALLTESAHSATAVAETDMEIGVLTRDRLAALVRRRPDIGSVVYRNLARGLGAKLRSADRQSLTPRS